MMRSIQFKWRTLTLILSVLTLLTLIPASMAQNDASLQFSVASSLSNVSSSYSSCASVDSCQGCSDAYTCHWCEVDQTCHAKGSYHGCAFGSSCENIKPILPPKENSTCAGHATCSECSLSSHLCHWCEYDNACHAVGSKYGCSAGVDCYSNDRCRRSEPETLVDSLVMTRISAGKLVFVLMFGATLILCASCCFCLVGGVKGAYDDLATTITMAGSVPPSFIGGTLTGPSEPFYTNLETHPEGQEEEEQERVEEGNGNGATGEEQVRDDSQADRGVPDEQEGGDPTLASSSRRQQQQQQQPNHSHDFHHELTSPLLQSYHGDRSLQEPTHARRLYRACAACYYVTVFIIVALCMFTIYFFPKKPVYNVCSDAVAWKKIIANIAAMKLNLGFEILISLENPNHLHAALVKGSGNFAYDGKHVGTFEIPPIMAGAEAITDLMLVAHVTPDHTQALQLAEAYYMGKLVLIADFEATLRVPALNNYVFDFEKDGIVVNVNQLQDRSLCACPTWDEQENSTPGPMLFLN